MKILAFSQNDAYSMHFDNVNLTRPCRLVSRNARKMGTTHGRTQHTLKGTVRQIFSPPSFACDFHGRNRDKFYICSQALLIIYQSGVEIIELTTT